MFAQTHVDDVLYASRCLVQQQHTDNVERVVTFSPLEHDVYCREHTATAVTVSKTRRKIPLLKIVICYG